MSGVISIDDLMARIAGDPPAAAAPPAAARGPRPRVDRGRSYICDENTLVRAHAMHQDGMSVRAVAREIFDDCYSASPKALANGLLNAWRARGWEIRSQSAATVKANVDRAFRPQCSHVSQASGRQGQRCERRCIGDDKTCWHHDPEQIAAGLARIRAAEEAA